MPRHAEVRKVAYQPDQMFALVADVEQYPKFLTWCVGARIRSRTDNELIADLTIGFGPFRESFTSRVTMVGNNEINVRYENGPFYYLRNIWRFLPDPAGCEIDFFVDFEFKNRILKAAIGAVFHEAVRMMVNAFLRRARDVYGAPTPHLGNPLTSL